MNEFTLKLLRFQLKMNHLVAQICSMILLKRDRLRYLVVDIDYGIKMT